MMKDILNSLYVHPTQTPTSNRRLLIENLQKRCIDLKFHYETPRQALMWRHVHHKLSPASSDASTVGLYREAAKAIAPAFMIDTHPIQLVSLGCGAGNKDLECMKILRSSGKPMVYTPVDGSPSLVLLASEWVQGKFPGTVRPGLVIDLVRARDLDEVLDTLIGDNPPRLYLFYGMLPGFSPASAFDLIRRILRPSDRFLMSANLVPDAGYPSGVREALSSYDNPITHEWLEVLLLDLGLKSGDFRFEWKVEADSEHNEVWMLVLYAHLCRAVCIDLDGTEMVLDQGESIRLFHSIRYCKTLLIEMTRGQGLDIDFSWVNANRNEGVFSVLA